MVYGIGLADECGITRSASRRQGQSSSRPGRRGAARTATAARRHGPATSSANPDPDSDDSLAVPAASRDRASRSAGRQSAPVETCEGTKPDPALRELAFESGGGYFELRDAERLASTFARVADELHQQYLLGFTPAVLDGKPHLLEVRSKRGGTVVRARRRTSRRGSDGVSGVTSVGRL